MQSPLYLLSWVTAFTVLVFVWTLGVKRLFLALFRERLFELRFELFQLGMKNQLPFDNESYLAVETLINALLRFGHRITLLTYVFSRREQRRAQQRKGYVDLSQQIALKISRLDSQNESKLTEIVVNMRNAIILYMAFTSLLFLVLMCGFAVLKVFGLRRLSDASGAVVDVIEREAYEIESRRQLGLATA